MTAKTYTSLSNLGLDDMPFYTNHPSTNVDFGDFYKNHCLPDTYNQFAYFSGLWFKWNFSNAYPARGTIAISYPWTQASVNGNIDATYQVQYGPYSSIQVVATPIYPYSFYGWWTDPIYGSRISTATIGIFEPTGSYTDISTIYPRFS